MPSPFPGMDPYLEGPHWTPIHVSLIGEIQRYLAPRLQPRYLVFPEERFVYDPLDGLSVTSAMMRPDVSVFEGPARTLPGSAVTLAAPLQLHTLVPETIPHITLEIRDVKNRQLVTAIEVLSPTNKRGEGRIEYLTKRGRILQSAAHLLEIDLLRQGERVPILESLPTLPYFVFLSRAEKRPLLDVWPITFDQSLPIVPVPLLPGDNDEPLDLQAVFTSMYDLLGLRWAVDYNQPPDIPLEGQAAVWAETLLHLSGLRG